MIQESQAQSERPRTSRGAPTLLCVDDEPETRRSLHRLLRKKHYALHFAGTGREALQYVQDHPVDLVITDQRMPEMSGMELLRELRQAAPDTPGLILTAYPESVFVDDPPETPRPPLFSKPWDDDTLLECIEKMLQARGRRSDPGTAPSPGASPGPSAPRTILVPLVGGIEAELALGAVLPLLDGDPIRVHLLQVITQLGLHRDVYACLEKTRERLSSRGIDAVADVRWGDAAEQILLHARHARADLIVLPRQPDRGWARRFGRSVAEQVLRNGEVPLLVGLPELPLRPWKRILVPLDGSRTAEAVLPEAVRLARKTGAAIDVVGVETWSRAAECGFASEPRDPVPYLTEIARYLGFEEVAAEPQALVGDPASEILRHARESGANLICMVSRSQDDWWHRILGTIPGRILRSAPCPVYVRRIPPA